MVETLHAAIAGRTRFRVKELYRSNLLKEHIERRLAEDPAVISARANTLTSAILVCHDFAVPQCLIGSLIEEAVSEFGQIEKALFEPGGWKPGTGNQKRDAGDSSAVRDVSRQGRSSVRKNAHRKIQIRFFRQSKGPARARLARDRHSSGACGLG